jgi:hypothetical protein
MKLLTLTQFAGGSQSQNAFVVRADEVIELRSFLLHCMSPLLAQSGHGLVHRICPLSGVKRTCRFALQMSAYDPKRT